MTVDAYIVEDSDGETHTVPAEDVSDIRLQPFGAPSWFDGPAYMEGRWDLGSDEWDRVTVLAALELHRSIDHGLRTADGTALEVIGEVCEAIAAPVLYWMSMAWGSWDFSNAAFEWPETDYLAALCLARDLPADAWDGSGWFDALQDEDGWQEPIYGQGCELDKCEDAWTACGGVVDTSADAGMTWLYRVVEDHTR